MSKSRINTKKTRTHRRKVTIKARTKKRLKQEGTRRPMMITAAACLLYARNRTMSAWQVIQGLGLFKCHASKVLYQRMNTCGLAVSHKKILQTVDKLSVHYDKGVLGWKKMLESVGSHTEIEATAVEGSHVESGGVHTEIEATSVEGSHVESGGVHMDIEATTVEGSHMESGGVHTEIEATSVEGSHMESGGVHTEIEATSVEGSHVESGGVHMDIEATSVEGSHMQSGGVHMDIEATTVEGSHMESGGVHTEIEATSVEGSHVESGGVHMDIQATTVEGSHMESGGVHTEIEATSVEGSHMESGGVHTEIEATTVEGSHVESGGVHMDIEATTVEGSHVESGGVHMDIEATSVEGSHVESGGVHTEIEATTVEGSHVESGGVHTEIEATTVEGSHMESGGVSCPGYSIVFDNIDIHQKVRHKTSQNSNKDHHFVNAYGVPDRVNVQHLPNDQPMADILSVPLQEFLPSEEDHSSLRDDMITISSRIVVKHIPFFNKYFKDCVQQHIPHMYSEQAKQKSHIVPLGILEKNESKLEDMIAIMEEYQKYVPEGQKIPLEGDGLSNMRGVEAQDARRDGASAADRLEGLELVTAEWHAHVAALQDIFDEFYDPRSAREKGTLFQLRNRFDRRSVTKSTKDSFNPNREFIHFVSSGMLIMAVMETLGLTNVKGRPSDAPRGIEANSLDSRRCYLRSAIGKVIDQHILLSFNTSAVVTEVETRQNAAVPEGRVPCGFPGCPKHYARDGACLRRHRERCIWSRINVFGQANEEEREEVGQAHEEEREEVGQAHEEEREEVAQANEEEREEVGQAHEEEREEVAQAHEEEREEGNLHHKKGQTEKSLNTSSKEDHKYNYNCSVLREGLYEMVKKDAVNEGDGNRIFRNWKFDMIQYYQHKHTHYKDLAFRYIAQHKALLTPRLSASILHNKTINTHGVPGKNIPKDLYMEFLNKTAKEGLAKLGPNMTSKTVAREGRSLGVLQEVLDTFDKDLVGYRGIGKHTVPDDSEEINMLVEDMQSEDPFKVIPGRFHPTFPTCQQSRHHNIDAQKMTAWMIAQKEKLGRRQHHL
ncbi:Protein unc-80 [Branchiostoma belcheri]|nr:Protein unc-80 [Branchiostoma belcheri]